MKTDAGRSTGQTRFKYHPSTVHVHDSCELLRPLDSEYCTWVWLHAALGGAQGKPGVIVRDGPGLLAVVVGMRMLLV